MKRTISKCFFLKHNSFIQMNSV